MFVAGLLHDIGRLIFFIKLPESVKEFIIPPDEITEITDLYLTEREVVGFDHAEVGGALIQHWNLPPMLQECAQFHHEPLKAKNFPLEAAIVYLANIIGYMAEFDIYKGKFAPKIEPRALKITGLSKSVIKPTIKAAQEQIMEVKSLFAIH